MENLIRALQIFLKYGNPKYPFYVVDDIFCIDDEISPFDVSNEDLKELEKLGFTKYEGNFVYNEGLIT